MQAEQPTRPAFPPPAELGFLICASADVPTLLGALLQGDMFDAWLEDPLLEHGQHGLQLRQGVTRLEALELITRWPEGRIFDAAADLRWERRRDGRLHLVAIADRLPGAFRTSEPIPLTPIIYDESDPGPEYLLLWGERPDAAAEWSEGRIPGLQQFYPSTWLGPRAAIMARTYEAPWVYASDMPPAVRTVTRYLSLVGNYQAPLDPRFSRQEE